MLTHLFTKKNQLVSSKTAQLVSEIQSYTYSDKTNQDLFDLSQHLFEKAKTIALEILLPEAYALLSETIFRVYKMNTYEVQFFCGIELQNKKLVEMQTGEGKTLSALFPAYLNALMCKGVHVLTFNDYLAERDANWSKPIFNLLGVDVSYVKEGMPAKYRCDAYNAHITYLTVKEAGFDYLRDQNVYKIEYMVHRPFYFAIIDEADSILIDEARIPLVIAKPS
jgi:preprotein translocase subunit SecA